MDKEAVKIPTKKNLVSRYKLNNPEVKNSRKE